MQTPRSPSALGVLILLVVPWMSSCTGPAKAEPEGANEAARPVAVAKVSRKDLSRDLELASEFRANQEVDLHAKVAGYLKAIHVDVGDRVSKGQLIAELEVPEMAQDLVQTSSQVKRSQLDVERARSELNRAQASYKILALSYDRLAQVIKAKPNLVAQQDVDNASARMGEAEAQWKAAQAALAATEQQVETALANKARVVAMVAYQRITAPFSGMITRRYADPGAMIQAGTASQTQAKPVVSLSEVDQLRVALPVPESAIASVRVGMPVEIRVDSLKRVFQTSVARITGRLDTSTRVMEVEADLANPGLDLRPGMYGYATLRLERRLDALALPIQAVSRGSTVPTVLLVDENQHLQERTVRLGMETPDSIEVLSGLRENDLVVVGNRSQLRPGMRVEPKLSTSGGADKEH